MKMEAVNMKKEWRCSNCSTLLGVIENGNLILRYKGVEYVVTKGQTMAVCRKCHRTNTIMVPVATGSLA